MLWLVFFFVQSSLLYYFLHTREESFFAAIRNRMHLSALAIKERLESSTHLFNNNNYYYNINNKTTFIKRSNMDRVTTMRDSLR